MKRVLVTGGSGMLGSYFSELCLKKGIEVVHLSHRKNQNSRNSIKSYFWSPKDKVFDLKALEGVDTVLHLAGATISKRWTTKYKQEIISSRVESTAFLFETLRDNSHRVKQVIGASAVGYYGNSLDLEHEYTEKDKLGDDFLAEVCFKWEREYDKFKSLQDIKTCVLRIGMLLSPNGGALEKIILPIKFGLGSPIASGKQPVSWIHIQDLARLILFCEQKKMEGVYNAVSPNSSTNAYLMQELASELHRPLFLPNVPAFFLKMILGEMSSLAIEGKKIGAGKILKQGFHFKYPDIQSAIREIISND